MEPIFKEFPDREAFDKFWKKHYVPMTYEDVQAEFEAFVEEADRHIFTSDYESGGCISREDFAENLVQAAEFAFQEALTEAFYDKNSEVYETAFEIFETAQLTGEGDAGIAQTFHEEYERLYREFLNCMFDKYFG